ncbi:MAG: biotin/lipoyl-containing protein [Candidatus Promineifilaceae bacterium]|nr:biotin/lipoyl-containing protein [Candidatus Promineifilaceae bacterium]
MKYITRVNGKEYEIEIDQEEQILVNGEPYAVNFQPLPGGGTLSLLINNRSLEATVDERREAYDVLIHGELYTVQVQDERAYRLAQARGVSLGAGGDTAIRSPMPGLVLDVLVEEGEEVESGEKVVILESMKMENELRASRDGVVLRVLVEKGASVEKDQELVVLGDASAAEEEEEAYEVAA